jgi:hypothetical protein
MARLWKKIGDRSLLRAIRAIAFDYPSKLIVTNMFTHKSIPEPVIVPILNAQNEGKQANQSKVKDLRMLRFEEFITARSLAPKSQKAYHQDIKYFLDCAILRGVM